MDWIIAFLIIAPAGFLAMRKSTWLVDYAIVVLAFNRGVRRMVDYYIYHDFNQQSPISLTPLVVALALLYVGVLQRGLFSTALRRILGVLSFSLGLGFVIGIFYNQLAAVFSLGEWLAGIGAMIFAASYRGGPTIADRWFKTAGWCAVLVAIYGWYQFFYLAPWDAFWLAEVKQVIGIEWESKPGLLSVFSTLGSRGDCAAFLGLAVIPMIANKRWRNWGGWLSVVLILSVLVLTTVRTMFIIIALVAILQPLLSRGIGIGRVLVAAAVFVAAATFGLSKLPNAERYQARLSTLGDIQEDASYQTRMLNFERGIGWVLRNPLGEGIGSTGGGVRLKKNGTAVVMDAGYIEIFAQFGWIGGVLFYAALWMMWREYSRRLKLTESRVDPFLSLGRATLVASVIFLFVGDIFSNFNLIWVIVGRALHPFSDPVFLRRWQEHRAQPIAGKTGTGQLEMGRIIERKPRQLHQPSRY
jgi:putative inorganic carbon (HCO3(-)) transporter